VEEIEAMLDDLSEQGLQTAIDQFFNEWDELSKDPESQTIRAMVVEYGTVFADILSQISEQLDTMQEDANSEIASMTDQVNSIAAQISELNSLIVKCEANGDNANEYRDERNNLLDALSELVDIEVRELENGMVNVSVGGQSLVYGDNTNSIAVEYYGLNLNYIKLVWEDTGTEVDLESGSIAGLIDVVSYVDGYITETGDSDADIETDASLYNVDSSGDVSIAELRESLDMMPCSFRQW